ncbi:MAG: hypothetical protein K2M05_09395, partial [Paramuribaculum sp.]|nr:hypothetical protein [Paramuribaculum sp.]
MKIRVISALCMLTLAIGYASAAKVNTERHITVNNQERKYILYVPDNVSKNPPLVISLHGAAGHHTDRTPFRMSVADSEGCIVVYPQGNDQYFPIFGGYTPGYYTHQRAHQTTHAHGFARVV